MKDWITPDDAARILERTPAHVRKLAETGAIRAERLGPEKGRGGRWLLESTSVQALKQRWDTEPPKRGRRASDDPTPAALAKRRSRGNAK